jgi:hypothetical protein
VVNHQRGTEGEIDGCTLELLADPTGGKLLKHIIAAGQVLKSSSQPAAARELVALRASQINGCGFVSTCTPTTPSPPARPRCV